MTPFCGRPDMVVNTTSWFLPAAQIAGLMLVLTVQLVDAMDTNINTLG